VLEALTNFDMLEISSSVCRQSNLAGSKLGIFYENAHTTSNKKPAGLKARAAGFWTSTAVFLVVIGGLEPPTPAL
jgi:hypothetical protein